MKRILKISSYLYFALLIYIFFLAWRRPSPSLHRGGRTLQLVPLYSKIKGMLSPEFYTLKDWLAMYIDFFGNIILFVPFAFILSVVFNVKSKLKIVLLAFLAGLSVELIQYTLAIGVGDIDDIILNTTGAFLGVLLLKYLKRSKHPVVNKIVSPA